MAYKLTESNGRPAYDQQTYTVDTPADLEKLPKNIAMGCFALVISSGDVYIKNSSGEWVKL